MGDGLYKNLPFPIGCAANLHLLDSDASYNKLVTGQFNSLTPEFLFKADLLHPSQHSFDFLQADRLVGYCQYHKKRIHGHTLVWHEALPDWILNFEGNKSDWEKLFKNHIQTIVSYFKGSVTSWDVVNEAFNEDGTLRETIWRTKLGDDYIKNAFEYARESDETALLFYNDYNLETNEVKRKAVLNYFHSLKEAGKINGMGLQMHIFSDFKVEFLREAFKEIDSENYMIHLSELEIFLNAEGRQFAEGGNESTEQAKLLNKILVEYTYLRPSAQFGLTFWNPRDKYLELQEM